MSFSTSYVISSHEEEQKNIVEQKKERDPSSRPSLYRRRHDKIVIRNGLRRKVEQQKEIRHVSAVTEP
jgi:hypothetical protein